MPHLLEEFNARKEHYWNDYDITVLDSEDIISATPGLLDEYDHDEAFKIAYCAVFFPYFQSTREYEVNRYRIMADIDPIVHDDSAIETTPSETEAISFDEEGLEDSL